ncbi:MAG: signal peptidase II [Oscillospiraceae bacterium]|nr:signal peptidase II [Oscillospiraceae bacterium]
MFQLITTIIAVILIAVDRITKNWAAQALASGDIAVIDKVLYFRYTENTGVAFSMFSDNRWVLVGITSVMLIVALAFFLSGKIKDKLELFALSLIIAGGVGNLIDRLSLGYVIDFIDVRIINFAIFNVADMCITIGAILVCIAAFAAEKREKREQESKQKALDEIDADIEKIFGGGNHE